VRQRIGEIDRLDGVQPKAPRRRQEGAGAIGGGARQQDEATRHAIDGSLTRGWAVTFWLARPRLQTTRV
jgi:hypothetical protein